MILKGISVNQDPPTKDYLWITPKGNTRFWNQSTWMLIGGSGGGGGADIPTIEAAGKYLVTTGTEGNYSMAWSDINLSSYINGTSGYAAVFNGNNSIISAIGNNSKIRIGNGIIEWDSTNNGFKIYNATSTQETPTTAGIYADWVSALGVNSSGGGGGGGMDEVALWQELTDDPQWTQGDDKIININHLPNNINADTVDGYHASSFVLNNGTGATGTWGININGNAATATKATQDGNGNTISSTYLPLAGGTMTGNLKLKANQYNREGALDCQNSDIINVNSILTANLADSFREGICFYRSASTWDCLSANNGTFYFGSNKAYGTAFAGDATINCGLINSTANGNTTTFGSQNASWCHIYNSADIPFIFNKSICSAGANTDVGSALGSYNYPWHVLYLGGSTSATMTNATTNPRIVFFESNSTPGSGASQAVALTYTGYDSYRASKGLKVHDMDGSDYGNVWLEVQGSIYTNYNLCINQTSGIGYGISLYGNNNTSSYGIAFAQTNSTGYNLKFGDVTGDWATYFNTAYGATRGWIFRADTGAAASLSTRGNFCAKGGVTALVATSSDRRLKKGIKQFNASNIIDKLNPVKFEWNSKAKKYNCNFKEGTNYGLIAQDSDGVIDDFVFDLPDGSGYKGVRYEKLIPILLQAIKEQNEKIENLEYEINVLKGVYK